MSIVYHPIHHVGVVAMTQGHESFVVWVASEDCWVPTHELESAERHFQREYYFQKSCPNLVQPYVVPVVGAVPRQTEVDFPSHPFEAPPPAEVHVAPRYREEKTATFPPPCWTGEPRPHGARSVKVRSNIPSPKYLTNLVTNLGYDPHAAWAAAAAKGHAPWLFTSDRRCSTNNVDKHGETRGNSPFQSKLPYIPVSSTLATTFGGGVKKTDVTAAIARHRWTDAYSTGVFEVVFLRRKPFYVAASLGLKLTTLYQYAYVIRAELGIELSEEERVQEADLTFEEDNSFVISGGV